MNVKLISYSQPAAGFEQLEDLGKIVAYCARVSNPTNQMNTETADRLLNYLFEHKHFSPFEMVNVVLEITTTRDIARQILRHRSFTFQEYSQRYAAVNNSSILREARLQDTKNRQNSIETDDDELVLDWMDKQAKVINAATEAYRWALDRGIAKEQARCVLPEGNTSSTLLVNGTLRSWIHYCALRGGNGTQKEHILIANRCAEVISEVFPQMEAFVSNG